MNGPPDPPPAPSITHKNTYAEALIPDISKRKEPNWFRLEPIPLAIRTPTYVNNVPVCIISPMEVELASKQLEFALVLKFSSGRPSLFEIRNHINLHWNLSKEPVLSLLDARHILMITACNEDMVRAQSRVSHRINSSLYRIFRWTIDFDFKRDSSVIPIWINLPKFPVALMNPAIMERVGNLIVKFISIDERTRNLTNTLGARMCVEVDVSKDLLAEIFIGPSSNNGYYQAIEYEGNNAYCTHCGLLGHIKGICRKLRVQAQEKNTEPINNKKVQILKRGQQFKEIWQVLSQVFVNS
ncbi:hypothetical protein CASFOL_027333 [Castilleja foliolosa]|uniref:DUF4283 domain-containing protein n=1 Tax=Castilleja foliolosa TaxID=1961234 RepID=A0ABD3CFD9_9LAMI